MLIFYFVIVAAGLGQAAMSGVTPEGEEMSVVQVGKFEKNKRDFLRNSLKSG